MKKYHSEILENHSLGYDEDMHMEGIFVSVVLVKL